VGYELASRRAIVLTGGRRAGEEGTPVKNRAVAGVNRAAEQMGITGPWIGVDKHGDRGPTVTPRSFVFNPGYRDRRNYLEALLCDAAVCFVGEDGTKSEVAFCLAVGRPVILVDYPPGEACPVENDEALARLVTDAQKRVVRPTSTDSPIDRFIAEAYDRIGTNLPPHEHASSRDPAPAAHIAELALDPAGVPPFPGDFPDWPTDVDVRNHYHRWLAALSP
jgi:predicted Rossmann-fold nucleotide-binding protein